MKTNIMSTYVHKKHLAGVPHFFFLVYFCMKTKIVSTYKVIRSASLEYHTFFLLFIEKMSISFGKIKPSLPRILV